MLCQCWCRRVSYCSPLEDWLPHNVGSNPLISSLMSGWAAKVHNCDNPPPPHLISLIAHHRANNSHTNEWKSLFSAVILHRDPVGVRGGDRVLGQVGGDADELVNEGAHWRARLSPELANYSDYPPSDPAPQHYSTLCCTDAGVRASIRSGAKTT